MVVGFRICLEVLICGFVFYFVVVVVVVLIVGFEGGDSVVGFWGGFSGSC